MYRNLLSERSEKTTELGLIKTDQEKSQLGQRSVSSMAKEDPDDLENVPRPTSIGKRTFRELQKILVDTNTGDMENFIPVV